MVDARESGATELYELIEGGRNDPVQMRGMSREAGGKRKDRMLEQVRCTSSWIHRRRWREVVRVRVPPTVPDRGTIPLKRREIERTRSGSPRARVLFIPFSAVSVACFDSRGEFAGVGSSSPRPNK